MYEERLKGRRKLAKGKRHALKTAGYVVSCGWLESFDQQDDEETHQYRSDGLLHVIWVNENTQILCCPYNYTLYLYILSGLFLNHPPSLSSSAFTCGTLWMRKLPWCTENECYDELYTILELWIVLNWEQILLLKILFKLQQLNL